MPTNSSYLSHHPQYRPDIDGLRAIAVLAVIIFHAFPDVLHGGFVGVDIFFVISGYLITSIIQGGLLKDKFSFGDFYLRRIKRIFPALILVIGFSYLLGWFVLYPAEYKQLGKHLFGGASFLSNFFFWQESGYFDRAAETKPLLHLWSLAVEEQYYIVWPLILYFAWKRHFSFLLVVGAIALVSFAYSVHFSQLDATQAFYSPLSRFWELLMGSMLAHFQMNRSLMPDWVNQLGAKFPAQAQSITGSLLIMFAVIALSKNFSFPGFWALFPTVGAALIITAGQQAWINRAVLAHPLMVWVGLISYPLYLWHWPLLSYAHIMESKIPSLSIRLIAVLLAFILAWLTYQFIETPIRYGKTSKTKVSALVAGMLLVAATGALTYHNDGWKSRLADLPAEQTARVNWQSCPFEGKAKSYCYTQNPDQVVDTILIGDSHAGHLAPGLLQLFGKTDRNISIQWGGDCLPFFETADTRRISTVCDSSLIQKILDYTIKEASIKTVMISSYAIAKIQRRAESQNRTEGYVNNPSQEEIERNANVFQQAMFGTLERLQKAGKRVIYIVDVPELYFDPKECLSRPLVLPGHQVKSPCAISRQAFEARNAEYHQIVQQARAQFPEILFIDSYKALCDESLCYGAINGELIYRDRDHLNAKGSQYLIDKISSDLLDR